jgi:glycosyltransferase involved in cell wall biosynthesis
VREVATRLTKRGHNVTVFTADAGKDVSSEMIDDGVRVRRFQSFNPGDAFYIAPQIALAVRRAEADVVHAHNYHAIPLLFSTLAVAKEKLVITTHYHGGSASTTRDRLLSVYHRIGQWAIRQADVVIAVGHWEYEQLSSDFDIEASIIPNGIDIDRFRIAESAQRDYPYLLTVGRLKEYKGVQHIIRVLPEFPKHELLIVGSGSYKKELVRLARKLRIKDRVNFVGYINDKKLAQLYAGAEAYITLSRFEAYGMTVPEALAAGTPCVVLRRAALNDWISYSGVIGVDTTSLDELRYNISVAMNTDINKIELPTWDTVTSELEVAYSE